MKLKVSLTRNNCDYK